MKLNNNLIWFVTIPSSMAFHALIGLALTFAFHESHIRLDSNAQLLPIQFVLLSGEEAQIPSVAESTLPVHVEAAAKPNPTEEASEKAEERPNPVEETYEGESTEEKTAIENNYAHEDIVEDTVIVEEENVEINKMNSSLSNTLEAQKAPSESLSQQDVYSLSQTYDEEHTISTTSEQSDGDALFAVPKAGTHGSYEAATETYAMFALNRPPPYPIQARRNGWEGKVVLEIVVSPSGECKRAQVVTSSGYPILDSAAIKAAKHWKFIPAKRNGRPLENAVLVPVVFRLNQR